MAVTAMADGINYYKFLALIIAIMPFKLLAMIIAKRLITAKWLMLAA